MQIACCTASLGSRMTSSVSHFLLHCLAFYEHGEPRKPRPSGLSSLNSPRAKTAKMRGEAKQRPTPVGLSRVQSRRALSFFCIRNSKAWPGGTAARRPGPLRQPPVPACFSKLPSERNILAKTARPQGPLSHSLEPGKVSKRLSDVRTCKVRKARKSKSI